MSEITGLTLLNDLHEARDDAPFELRVDFRSFCVEFVGAMAMESAKTPEGREAWTQALKAVTRS